jgi:hypothetical protein
MLVEGQGDGEITPRTAAAFLIHNLAGAVQVSEPADNVLVFGAALRSE